MPADASPAGRLSLQEIKISKTIGLLFLPALLAAAPSVVTVSGRTLVVNGQTFTVKGVNYSPIPVGSTGDGSAGCLNGDAWWANRSVYIADFPLIHQMGANTVRTYDTMNDGIGKVERNTMHSMG